MNVREQPPSLGWRCGRGARSSRAMKKAAKQIAADKRRLTQIENKEAKSVLSALIGVYLRLNCVFQQPASARDRSPAGPQARRRLVSTAERPVRVRARDGGLHPCDRQSAASSDYGCIRGYPEGLSGYPSG